MSTAANRNWTQLEIILSPKKQALLKQIKVNVDEAKTLLNKISAKVTDVRAEKTQLQTLLALVQENWTGYGADAMTGLLEETIAKQEAIAAELEANTAAMLADLRHLEDEDEALAILIQLSTASHGSGGGIHG